MIITRYLVWETIKNQLIILFILLFIFFFQKLIKTLSSLEGGEIAINTILTILGLGMPKMAQLILPLSLFLSILITFGRLCTDSEITVMQACGLGHSSLIKSAMILIAFTTLVSILNNGWIEPWSTNYENGILQKIRSNPGSAMLWPKKFQKLENGQVTLFIEERTGNQLKNIFLAKLRKKDNTLPYVIIAKNGKISEYNHNSSITTLTQGTCFQGHPVLHNFRITSFKNYQLILTHDQSVTKKYNVDQINLNTLWMTSSSSPVRRSELHWRLTLIFSVLVMGLMAVPLGIANPQKSRIPSILIAIFLYLIFFLLQSLMHSASNQNRMNPALSMWIINFSYLTVSILSNTWNTLLVRRLRAWLFHQGDL
ncbi:Lipopolysaccharide export system permease protein LptF [Candidatus Erwinia haradaeae]|uniref:Lipopolysaccharide export system permease protein LptF n=1 Tax=Candidatus Erwinia haradaeae TaxID=1922217 RepID=A0A451CZT4_9GAMM|nr:LPS export ABC transporter permease LptF [Candidatus Erwinia haradaeae]VFP78919.1 Lipopolysaccharide export system permease protein LptF [Candidatus Erwinia haradaeae]